MRKGFAITLAVVGTVATVALFALNGAQKAVSFFETTDEDVQFTYYINEYRKSYGTKEEYEFRKEQYFKNLQMFSEINSQNDVTYRVGVNKFADWSDADYKRLLGKRSVAMPSNSAVV